MVAFGKLPHPKGWHEADLEALRSSENRWVLVWLSYWMRLKIRFFSVRALFFKHKPLGLAWKRWQRKTSQLLSLLRSLIWDDRHFSSRKVNGETEVLYWKNREHKSPFYLYKSAFTVSVWHNRSVLSSVTSWIFQNGPMEGYDFMFLEKEVRCSCSIIPISSVDSSISFKETLWSGLKLKALLKLK